MSSKKHVRMFHIRFAPLVHSGVKRQTVRPVPKREVRAGDILDARHWDAKPYRSKHIKIGLYRIVRVADIRIDGRGVLVDGRGVKADSFARKDGFTDFNEMLEWFQLSYSEESFEGIVIFWEFS